MATKKQGEESKGFDANINSGLMEEKRKALSAAVGNIEKVFGKGAIMRFGDKTENVDIDCIPTGSLSLDIALGVGGIPRGRIVEIYGPEASGKTTLTLHIISQAQKMGGIVAFIDAEHALDPSYARKLGVNIDEMYISQPDDGEQALDIADEMVRSGAIDVIVIDSVAALVPRAEIDGDMGASHMGLQARLMSQALRKLTGICNKNNCMIIFTNQLREKIGISFGNPETTTGGRALKFYASVRLEIRRGQAIKIGDKQVGHNSTIKVSKNKVSPPFKTCIVDVIFGEGISKEGEILDIGVELGLVNKSGAWFSYGDERLGQGRENAKQTFKEQPELCLEIENKIRAHFGLKTMHELLEIHYKTNVSKQSVKQAEKPRKPKKASGKAKDKVEEDEDEIEIDELSFGEDLLGIEIVDVEMDKE